MGYHEYREASAIADAILRGDKQMLMGDKVINLPSGQGAGTETQKHTYANQKAIEILDKMQEDKNKHSEN